MTSAFLSYGPRGAGKTTTTLQLVDELARREFAWETISSERPATSWIVGLRPRLATRRPPLHSQRKL